MPKLSNPITVALVITTDEELAAVEHARKQFNEARPQTVPASADSADGKVKQGDPVPNPELIPDAESYIKHVFRGALQSYQTQKAQFDREQPQASVTA